MAINKKKADSAAEEEDVLELVEEVSQNITGEAPAISDSLDANNIAQKVAEEIKSINDKQDQIMSNKLVSENTAEATTALFTKLKESTKSKQSSESLKFRSGTSVEEIIAELIKPDLSLWLDKHLAGIVKTVVEKEVKKLLPSED